MGKDSLFNKWCLENWYAQGKDETRPPILHYRQKWTKNWSVRPEIILLEENTGEKLPNIGLSNDFLVIALKAQVWASLVAQMKTNLPAMQQTWIRSLGQKDPLEDGMATDSSILV